MKKKILVIDSESSIREALSKVLSAENYGVVAAENGQEAVDKFGTEKIDLLLLDLGLPAKDGLSALKWLTCVNPLLPVVIVTARNNQHELAEEAGVDVLMEKPFDVPHLLQTIRALIYEPVKRRAKRVRQRASGIRNAPYDIELFDRMLRKRFTISAPYSAAADY